MTIFVVLLAKHRSSNTFCKTGVL